MSRRLLAEVGKSQRITILETLKRRGSLSVQELATVLKMSYMGVKQHCVSLQKDGYLSTWRKPGALGRPQMVYRLSSKAHDLYEKPDNHLSIALLEASKKLFGTGAAEKLLFQFFQLLAEGYARRLRGETPKDRARAFAKLRDEEGYMTLFSLENDRVCMVEHHHPYLELLDAYTVWERMETEMINRLIGVRLRRECQREDGMYRCVFTFD
ncbi:MAG: hypothetical protein ABI443_01800 [Chthoniobacterales bacterium]